MVAKFRELKQRRRRRQRERQKKETNKQNNNFAGASHLFVHFLGAVAGLRYETY